MSYEYTDPSGIIRIQNGIGAADGRVRFEVDSAALAAALIKDEDAPAVALAILEAAGCDKAGKTRLSRAMIALIEHISAEKVRAEREAEDAKVDEYRRVILAEDVNRTTIRAWNTIAPETQNMWRRKYRAAREFFAKEDAPAPRVLQYGDPEPEIGTKWIDASAGDEWVRKAEHWTCRKFTSDWAEIQSVWRGTFPWTEVTGDAR